MRRLWRAHLRRACTVLTLLAAAAGSTPAAGAAGPTMARVRVSGTLLVAPAESAESAPSFAVRTDDGGLLVLASTDVAAEDQAGMRFTGAVSLPVGHQSAQAALDAAQRTLAPVRVLSARLSAAPAPAATASTHRWYAAAPSNFGALDQTDAALLDEIGQMATYWESQADGAIADIVPPTGIARYTATATSTAAGCGLTGSDFWAAVGEAAALFPAASFGGGDQLILLMPSSCVTGGVAGRGSVGGLSFGNGGYTIDRHSSSIFKQTLAHELGHNYGFGHARLGPCAPTCATEYGDYYSVMGAVVSGFPQPTALSTPYRMLQGITDAGEVETLLSADTATTYTRTLSGRSGGTGLRSVGFVDPSTGHTMYVDYRSGTGADSGTYYTTGAAASSFRKGVVVEEVTSSTGIALVPDGTTKALVAGESRSFAGGDVTLSVTAMSSASATVELTLPGLPAYPTPGTVSINGVARLGSTVTAGLSGQGPAPTAVGYQWLSAGTPIPGATAASFTPGPEQVGPPLSVAATVSAPGYAPATVTSSAVTVAPGTLTLTALPVVSGVARVGSPVTCEPPALARTPDGLALAVTWRRDGTPLPGATADTYLPVAADLAGSLACVVDVTAPGYTPVTATSDAVTVALGRLSTQRPTLAGTPRGRPRPAGRSRTCTDGARLRFRWYADGTRVPRRPRSASPPHPRPCAAPASGPRRGRPRGLRPSVAPVATHPRIR
ncbi:MAG: hypothetical protein R2734_02270 [Nocardioides sp.]